MANAIIVPPLPIASVTASSTSPGYDPAYLANDFAGVLWMMQPDSGAGYVNVVVDLGRDVAADTVMLFGLGGASAAMTLQVYAATAAQGANFAAYTYQAAGDLLAGTVMPQSGRGTALHIAPATVTARYWLIRMVYPAGGAQLSASRVVIGQRIRLERNFGFGAAFGVRDLGTLDFGRRGVLQRARGKKLRTVGLTFSNIRQDEVEVQTRPLIERIGNTEMIALVTDPAAHAQRQNRCYFGPLVGDLGHTWRKANLFEAKANLVSIF